MAITILKVPGNSETAYVVLALANQNCCLVDFVRGLSNSAQIAESDLAYVTVAVDFAAKAIGIEEIHHQILRKKRNSKKKMIKINPWSSGSKINSKNYGRPWL